MGRDTDNPGTGIVGVRIDPVTKEPIQVQDERDHFTTCPGCGQSMDMRQLGEVFHHATPGHEPLEDDA